MKIKELKRWDAESVRAACIKHGLYTAGDCKAYDRMLNQVELLSPNTENIYTIAEDIVEHSDEQTVSNVMFILANEAVTVFYDLQDGEN